MPLLAYSELGEPLITPLMSNGKASAVTIKALDANGLGTLQRAGE